MYLHGQSSLEAAVREVNEEIGIEINSTDLNYILTYKKESKEGEDLIDKQIFDCYIVNTKEINIENIIIQESEVEGVKLVSKEEFKWMIENENMSERPIFYKALLEYL